MIYLTLARSLPPEDNRAVEIVRSTAKVKCWSYRTGTWQETC